MEGKKGAGDVVATWLSLVYDISKAGRGNRRESTSYATNRRI